MTPEPIIAVLDDDAAVRDSLRLLLMASGYQVAVFSSPLEFLDSDAPARCACLVVDVRMPGLTGLEVQERLVAGGSTLPVIVMTGHGDVPLAVAAMKAGALDFIEKPFEEETLLTSLQAALSRPRAVADASPPSTGTETPSPEALACLDALTPRELDVLQGLVDGKPNKIIAFDLSISPRTVEIHRARVMEKMRASSLSHLVRLALAAGIRPNAG
ncbi:response regulator transcription factor [Nitrospirillum amazonense]|uniref:LuxR family two component transcriptional regulator n=1 Tax=Nitrospirillum amazonense TaxID=28077 RepID=A0A560JV63_9PROT|nr:response regulator transcription factor [Nitrospirillum amazonense]MDG3440643.1 response regulator transcription factor [Nitrospirillum amazonense]TWB75022.1 LuxR family two component transcriptional regulator [Nitrospirillum amazonense]